MTEIGVMAFRSCTNLAHIVIPESVKKIGNFAFESCASLEKITIPAGVQEIGKGIFVACDALSCIVVEEGNPVYDSRKGCNAIIETANNKLIAGCCTTIVPDDVRIIGEHAFAGCNSLTSIVIPDSVESIEEYAFNGCFELKNLTLPANCKKAVDIF